MRVSDGTTKADSADLASTTGPASMSPREYRFGIFRLIPERQALLDGDEPVRIGTRALDILTALVERPGEIISKRELMARAWPTTYVDESNLKVQVAALRRALDCGLATSRFVATSPGRGYRFVVPVEAVGSGRRPDPKASHNLPQTWTRPLGRTASMEAIADDLKEHRFVTVTGPGGIGKTTVALAVAHALIGQFEHGIWFVDLTPLRDPRLTPRAVASALGLTVHSEDVAESLARFLKERRLLLVLDCCEHVIDAAAPIAQLVFENAPHVQILATSREPLSVRGEIVHRLEPLATPQNAEELTAHGALTFPAVQLFVERASAAQRDFVFSNADAPVVAEICRKLDGIALAIELAATRTSVFGVRQLLALLDDRFGLLTRGHRTDEPRHHTLTSALDWSYNLLPEREQIVLRRLASFVGAFPLESAVAVVISPGMTEAAVVESVANLVDKSLVSADVNAYATQYRLLDTTRAYARQKLLDNGELAEAGRRHAEHQCNLLESAEREWESGTTDAWLIQYSRRLDDARSALAWAFEPSGDVELGVALTAAMIPLWMEMSLIDECRNAIERALSHSAGDAPCDARRKIKLWIALGTTIMHTKGPLPRSAQAWSEALRIAEATGDGAHRLRALWGLCDFRTWVGDHTTALEIARTIRAQAIEQGDHVTERNVGRQIATALRHLCDLPAAHRELEVMIAGYVAPPHRSLVARFQHDPRAAAWGTLANVQWLQGYPDQAVAAGDRSLAQARTAQSALALCNALAHTAIPISLYTGDWAQAERLLNELDEQVAKHGMAIWRAVGRCLRGVLEINRGGLDGVSTMQEGLEHLRASGFRLRYPAYVGVLACGLAAEGWLEAALETVDHAITAADNSSERWCVPELLRMKGEILLRQGTQSHTSAEQHFLQALMLSRRYGTVAWETRAAGNLSRIGKGAGRSKPSTRRINAPVASSPGSTFPAVLA